MKTPKISALIPARCGSKRVPGKNVRDLGGIPLMAWSIYAARKVGWICWVSSNSREYLKTAESYGAKCILRPAELSSDNSGDYGVIKQAMGFVDSSLIAYLRPTTPFRKASVLRNAVKYIERENGSGLRSIEEMGESVYKCFGLNGKLLEPFMLGKLDYSDCPNQLCPKSYHPNGYIDIVRREVVEWGELWDDKCLGFITPRTIEIDTEEDFEFVAVFLFYAKTSVC